MKQIIENSPLCLALGKTPSLKLIVFLISHQSFDYSKTELAAASGLSRSTIYVGLPPLLKYEIVLESRKIGNTTLYKLNIDSPAVKAIIEFNEVIIKFIVDEEINND